jgi:Zn ribbon nucleic-acid-binding protein/transposase-like protein
MARHTDDLWRDFPKTAIEFEECFATEKDCRAYWIEARWGGRPACAKCESTRVWSERDGKLFECGDCGHQTSLTSGTVLEKTKKPLKVWFRAVFEISSRKNGISAKDLQRIMGFGSYKTAWSWLHKIRASLMRSDATPLDQDVEMDEAFVGSKRLGKALVLVAAEPGGRVRLALAENNDEATLKRFADAYIAPCAAMTTDGLASYNARSLGERQHDAKVQTAQERREKDALQTVHWVISVLKRWLLGTHGGAVKTKHLQSYLDEFQFRYNRRKTNGVARLTARAIEQLVTKPTRTMRQIIKQPRSYRALPDVSG